MHKEYYFRFIDTEKLNKKAQTEAFPFSANLFWDSAPDKIDLQKNQRYVIERVLTRGGTEDFYLLLKLYSSEQIKDALRRTKELDDKTMNFCSDFFNLPKTEMHVSSFYH